MKFILIIILSFITTTSFAQWSYMGLGGTEVTDLTIHNDTLYASTYNGIFKTSVFSSDTTWKACGMQGKHVIQTLIPNYQTFLCVAEINSSHQTQIYKSDNAGDSFRLLTNNVSLGNSYNFLDKIAHPEENYDTLYSLDHQLRTFDGGVTWDTLSNMIYLVNRFIKVNPENHSQIFVGGETITFSPYLQTSLDYGENWNNLPNMTVFFGGDNVIHDMIIDGNNWFAAGEGVIVKTTDGGNNWQQLLNLWDYPAQWGLYITDIEFSPTDKKKLYATGQGYSVDIVPLLCSTDGGENWDLLSYIPENLPSGMLTNITCLTIKNTTDEDKVFLGGKGVYKYENSVTRVVNPTYEEKFDIFPNPALKKFKMSVPASANQVQIKNLEGKILVQKEVKEETELNFEIESCGLYLVQITTDKGRTTKKVIIQ